MGRVLKQNFKVKVNNLKTFDTKIVITISNFNPHTESILAGLHSFNAY